MKLQYTEENVALFLQRFATDKWATQESVDRSKGTTVYVPGEGPLTPVLVRKHLDTSITLGVSSILTNNTCRFIVIDFDLESKIGKELVINPGSVAAKNRKAKALAELREEVVRVMAKLSEQFGISRDSMLLELSGSKGYHVWLFFAENIPSRDAFKMARIMQRTLDITKYEVFPKQEFIEEGRSGFLIKVPLGINRKTNDRCLFLGDDFNAVAEGQWAALENVQTISTEQVNNILNLQCTEADNVETDTSLDLTKLGGSIDLMISKCSALQNLVAKSMHANPDDGAVNLTHDERICIMTIMKSFGALGNTKIHDFMRNTDNYDYDKTEKAIESSGNMKPMRCQTMIDRGICPGLCENIKACGGRSPVKLAGAGSRKDGQDIYILKNMNEIENPIICNKKIRVDFTINSLIGGPFYSFKKVTFAPCSPATCPNFEGKCGNPDKDCSKEVEINDLSKLHIKVYGADEKQALMYVKEQVRGCTRLMNLRLESVDNRQLVQPFSCSNIILSLSEEEQEDSKVNLDASAEELIAAKEQKDYYAFYLGNVLESSKNYRGYGKVLPNPKDQSITMLFDKVEPLNSQIDSFKMTDKQLALFEEFKNITLKEKISDISNNISMIYGRDEIILAILLTHFSVLEFSFNKSPVSKGWVETLLVGDTGQAKSILTLRIMNYIGLGRACSSNSSTAGLIGGIDKIQNKNYITWGTLPRSNKALLFIDEIQNMSSETTMQLRTARANGYADVNKIVKGRRAAKVRLICAANPVPKEKTMADFLHGALAFKDLMPSPDLRRFDLACVLNAADNNVAYINKVNEKKEPILSREMLRTAVLWAWSRKPDNIIFTDKVTRAILKGAQTLSDKFDVNSVPICNASDMREKLARLVVALAALIGRTDDNINLKPDVEDVAIIIKYLDAMYSHPSMGLDVLSKEKRDESDLSDLQYEEIKGYLNKEGYGKIKEVIKGFATAKVPVKPNDICSWAQVKFEDKNRIMYILTSFGLVEHVGSGTYIAKTKLMKFYRRLGKEVNGERKAIF